MSNFEEKLITAVYIRPCIYDKGNENHSKSKIIGQAWNEVSEESGAAVQTCQRRWRSLRDTFYRKYRGKGGKSGDGLDGIPIIWKWYESLMFLAEHNIPKRTTDNFNDDSQGTEDRSFDETASELDPESPASSQIENTEEDDSNQSLDLNNAPTPKLKRPHVWYSEHAKGRSKKQTTAGQWGTVIDKCTKMLQTSTDDGKVDPFAVYISSEMAKMTETEQDTLKFGVMDLIKSIKASRVPDFVYVTQT